MGYDWEALLAADKVYTGEELVKDLDRINKEANKKRNIIYYLLKLQNFHI